LANKIGELGGDLEIPAGQKKIEVRARVWGKWSDHPKSLKIFG
jgi:hypothetical protein